MSRRSRNATIVSTALVALALVAGCSGGTSTPTAGQPPAASAADSSQEATALLERVPEATFAAGSARYEMQLNISAQGQTMQAAGAGAYDFARGIGSMTLDGAILGMQGEFESVMDGETVYVRFPGQPGWFRSSAGAGAPGGQYDPARQLELLRNASSDLRVVGTEELRGEQVEHIAFTFDPQQMAETLGQGGEAAEAVTAPVPADIWIDGDGRARKFQLRMPVNQEGVSVETDMTIEYFDFGAPVDVQVPDAAQVQDLPTIPTAPR